MTQGTQAAEVVTAHQDVHSEQGALRGEHPGRAKDPVIKARGLAWLEFEKTDLDRTEMFARDFGLTVHSRTADELLLRASRSAAPCVVVRRGERSRFVGAAFEAAEARDLDRIASATGATVEDRRDDSGGRTVSLTDPTGIAISVVHGVAAAPSGPLQEPLTWNIASTTPRVNATQRPPREPARVERLGHIVFATRVFARALDWYLEHLGLIVSDFLFIDGQRDRGPCMAFIRCDRGSEPSDHHTLAMLLAPEAGYVHSAYEVADLDAMAAGGEYLRERGWQRSWGIGRHIQGSQVFDLEAYRELLMLYAVAKELVDDGRQGRSVAVPGSPVLAVPEVKPLTDLGGERDRPDFQSTNIQPLPVASLSGERGGDSLSQSLLRVPPSPNLGLDIDLSELVPTPVPAPVSHVEGHRKMSEPKAPDSHLIDFDLFDMATKAHASSKRGRS